MSDASPARVTAMSEPIAAPLLPSAGTLLRQAREAAGLHIGALSVSLKVPVMKLEALEADRLDLLPDAVFARALAASVCRTLKVDPGPILSRLPQQIMSRLQLESRTTDRAGLHAPRVFWRAPMLARLPKPVLVVAGLLLVGALALYLLPSTTSAPWVFAPVKPVSAVIEPSGPTAVLALPAAPPSTPVLSSDPSLPAAPGLSLATAPAAALEASAQPAAAAPAPITAAPGASVVLFKAKGVSWVEVTDGSGVLQLRKVLNPGEAAPVSGTLPLSVVIGRADAVDVLVRGQPFALQPFAKDNVARFQVK